MSLLTPPPPILLQRKYFHFIQSLIPFLVCVGTIETTCLKCNTCFQNFAIFDVTISKTNVKRANEKSVLRASFFAHGISLNSCNFFCTWYFLKFLQLFLHSWYFFKFLQLQQICLCKRCVFISIYAFSFSPFSTFPTNKVNIFVISGKTILL